MERPEGEEARPGAEPGSVRAGADLDDDATLAAVLRAAPTATVVLDLDGVVLLFNDAFAALLERLGARARPGIRFDTWIAPAQRRRFADAWVERLERTATRADAFTLTGPEGRAPGASLRSVLVTDRDDRPRAVALFVEDVFALLARRLDEGAEEPLSEREREIALAVVEGGEVATVAATFHLSEHTVRNHLKAAYRKLGVHSRVQLALRLFGASGELDAD